MPDDPLETAAEAVSDAADALQDAAKDAAKETETVAAQPVVVIERAAEPVAEAPSAPATMQPHEHPEISSALKDLTDKITGLVTKPADDAAGGAENLAGEATAPVATAANPVAEPVSNAVESTPKRVHALFRPLFGGKS